MLLSDWLDRLTRKQLLFVRPFLSEKEIIDMNNKQVTLVHRFADPFLKKPNWFLQLQQCNSGNCIFVHG